VDRPARGQGCAAFHRRASGHPAATKTLPAVIARSADHLLSCWRGEAGAPPAALALDASAWDASSR